MLQKYGAGPRVYGSGRSAPNVGRNDPTGYVNRELNKPSQSRSGLAATALQRLKKNRENANGKPKGRNSKPKPNGPNRPKNNNGPNKGKGNNNGPNKGKGNNNGPNKGKGKGNNGPNKRVKVHKNGVLELPWNGQNALQATSMFSDYDQGLQGIQSNFQNYIKDYQQQMYGAKQDYGDLRQDTLNNFSGRGMAFSSGYGDAVEQNATGFNNFQNSMQSNKADTRANAATTRNEMAVQLKTQLAKMGLQQGMDLGQLAGTLGYGKAGLKAVRARFGKGKKHKPGKKHKGDKNKHTNRNHINKKTVRKINKNRPNRNKKNDRKPRRRRTLSRRN